MIGSIEVGKFADFAGLAGDPTEVAAEQLKDVEVWGTVLGGRTLITPFAGNAAAESTLVLIGRFTDDECTVKRCLDNTRAVNAH